MCSANTPLCSSESTGNAGGGRDVAETNEDKNEPQSDLARLTSILEGPSEDPWHYSWPFILCFFLKCLFKVSEVSHLAETAVFKAYSYPHPL